MNYLIKKTAKFAGIALLFLSLIFSCKSDKELTPETALESYLEKKDKSFEWELVDSYGQDGLKIYNLLLTSQQWRKYKWRHQLSIVVPDDFIHEKALLFITGGSNENEMPKWKEKDDDALQIMGLVAKKNKAMVAVLYQVPNQPLYGDLTEDELISYTLHNYRNDKDLTWPLLFPMVKSAVMAMNAIESFSVTNLEHEITGFVVSGASKRGWTTWLTGASDSRVEAIAPMVIDMLNMPKNISYHLEAWGDYSIQIQDYVELGIAQDIDTPEGQEITTMIDPFSYRERLTMPKLIFIGTNDEYWPVDAVKHYFDQIPGENYIHYVPNAGHGLGDKKQAIQALSAFFGETLENIKYPACSWSSEENEKGISITVKTSPEILAGALLWSSDSEDRDFRDNEFLSKQITNVTGRDIKITINYPDKGFRAFYIDLLYPHPNGGIYSKSTKIFLADEDEIL
jgi:PhoPQ-activated pathogenicity-related protein